jgi:hypothetical protein
MVAQLLRFFKGFKKKQSTLMLRTQAFLKKLRFFRSLGLEGYHKIY